MALQMKPYQEVRKQMQPGDVIAFGGKSAFSGVIKWFTGSPVSHVAIVLQTKLVAEDGDGDSRFFNQIIESTVKEKKRGVIISRLSQAVNHYHGELWWLPLSSEIRAKLNRQAFFNWLMEMEGTDYDIRQLLPAAIDVFGSFSETEEDFSKLFCSELVAGALEAGGAIPQVNASEVTPDDLVRWKIYAEHYCQLKGEEEVPIDGYNSLSVESN